MKLFMALAIVFTLVTAGPTDTVMADTIPTDTVMTAVPTNIRMADQPDHTIEHANPDDPLI